MTAPVNFGELQGQIADVTRNVAREGLLPDDLGLAGQVVPAPSLPGDVAEELLRRLRDRGIHLLRWQGTWVVYSPDTRGRYARVPEVDDPHLVPDLVRNCLARAEYLDDGDTRPWNPTRSRVAEVVAAIETRARASAGLIGGTWLDPARERDHPGRDIIACRNGLLHVDRATHVRALLPHTDRFFTETSVDLNYSAAAEPPQRWLKFLEELWPGDEKSAETLQEWFGYVLSRGTALHKILLIVGPPRSGKGTIGWVMEQLLGGREEVAHPTLRKLGDSFGLAPLLGKALAIIGDARITGETKSLVETLLTVSGEDAVSVNRKNKAEVQVRLGVRFVVLSNEEPDLRDDSGAMANRFVPLKLTESFLGREDLGLKGALERELPGIFNWALAGLERLRRNGKFTLSQESRDTLEDLIEGSSPTKQFVRDCCVVGPEHEVARSELFSSWRMWAVAHGYNGGSEAVFGRNLRAALAGVKDVRRGPKGGQVRMYRGLRLRGFTDVVVSEMSGDVGYS